MRWLTAASIAGVYLIGLTGGIASGKSTVARRLAELGAVHIDADQLARTVVEPGRPALARIVDTFGAGVLAADGSLDRAALGSIVFADPDALRRLNAIVHPAVREESDALLQAAERANPDVVVVYDVPLLVEATGTGRYDLVVVVHADEMTRLERMIELRGMSEADAAGRLKSQASDAERLAVADVVIEANGSLVHTMEQVDALWENIRSGSIRPAVSGAP
jgi:dephospho-CoA kinase